MTLHIVVGRVVRGLPLTAPQHAAQGIETVAVQSTCLKSVIRIFHHWRITFLYDISQHQARALPAT